jgi:hypothetical protein
VRVAKDLDGQAAECFATAPLRSSSSMGSPTSNSTFGRSPERSTPLAWSGCGSVSTPCTPGTSPSPSTKPQASPRDSVALPVDRVFLAQWAGKPGGESLRALIQTTRLEWEFLLDMANSVSLAQGPSSEEMRPYSDARRGPTAARVRADSAGSYPAGDSVVRQHRLDELRQLFSGFDQRNRG